MIYAHCAAAGNQRARLVLGSRRGDLYPPNVVVQYTQPRLQVGGLVLTCQICRSRDYHVKHVIILPNLSATSSATGCSRISLGIFWRDGLVKYNEGCIIKLIVLDLQYY